MKNDQRVWTAFILLSLTWGTSFLFIKIGLRTLDPLMLVALRLLIGLMGLLIILKWRRISLPKGWSNWRHIVFLGFANTAIPFSLITWAESGENGIDSGAAAVLNSTVPFFALIIAGVIVKSERITMKKVLGLFVGFAGVMLLMSDQLGGGSGSFLQQLAIVAASFCYGVSGVYGQQHVSHMNPAAVATGQLLTAEAVLLAATLLFVDVGSQTLNPATVGSLLALGLFGSCLAYILFFFILRNWGATRTALVTYMIPVVGVTAGVIILKETLDWRLLMGGVLIVGGVVIVNWRAQRQQVVEPDSRGYS